MRRILVALGFLTIIPVKVDGLIGDEHGRSMVYFPLIGLFIGAILIIIDRGTGLLPSLLNNLLILTLLVILTGALHLDGLADTLDGFYAGRTKEEILAIMRDSRTGVMGATGIVLVLLAKWASLYEMPLAIKDRALLLAPMLARWSMVLAAFIAPYAREGEGLGRPFAGKISLPTFLASGLSALVASVVIGGIKGIFLLLLAGLLVIGVVEIMKRRIGGMTGDTLGAVCEVVEVVVLVTLTIKI